MAQMWLGASRLAVCLSGQLISKVFPGVTARANVARA
jgi:hypothetical protein